MAGVGYSIAQISTILINDIIFGLFGSFEIASGIMLIITLAWIMKAGTNGFGVLITGWAMLLYYFGGGAGYPAWIPSWIAGVSFSIMIISFVVYVAIPVIKGVLSR